MIEDIKPGPIIYNAIILGEVSTVKEYFDKYPEIRDIVNTGGSWLFHAAITPHLLVAKYMLDLGMDVNLCVGVEKSTPLQKAIGFDQLEMTRFLLSKGANPNIGRPIIGAINHSRKHSEERALEFTKLLVEHGVNVNEQFMFYGNKDQLFTALDWAASYPKVAAFLKSHGAKTNDELSGKQVQPQKSESANNSNESQVVNYFTEHYGQPETRSLIEIVPVDPPIAVHVIPPTRDRKHVTLFTSGMSAYPMTLPNNCEEDYFRFAELFIQLPSDWKYRKLEDPEYGWPIHWLRNMGKYPHQNKTWLGGPVTVVDNGKPPAPIAPNLKFDSMLLLAEHELKRADGNTVNLYRLMPLYPEERLLEKKSGIAALMRAFDRESVPFIFQSNRPNVAKK